MIILLISENSRFVKYNKYYFVWILFQENKNLGRNYYSRSPLQELYNFA